MIAIYYRTEYFHSPVSVLVQSRLQVCQKGSNPVTSPECNCIKKGPVFLQRKLAVKLAFHGLQRQSKQKPTRLKSFQWNRSEASVSNRQRLATVTELVILLKVKPDVTTEASEALLDTIWSLQYMTGPGVLCAFAGESSRLEQSASGKSSIPDQPLVSHGVHFRFASKEAAEGFLRHPQFLRAVTETAQPLCKEVLSLHFEVQVPTELEDMFRRGPDWEGGFEHVLAMEAQRDRSEEEAARYCHQLREISVCALAGGLQSSAAVLLPQVSCPGLQPSKPDALLHVLMTRFQRRGQLRGFLELPPCQRLLDGDRKLPVSLKLNTAFTIAEAQKSRTSSPGANRLGHQRGS